MQLNRTQIGNRFEYVGDEIGTEFERAKWRLTSIGIDTVNFRKVHLKSQEDFISPTKEEVRLHLEVGTLKPV